jgi:hypothetical protein
MMLEQRKGFAVGGFDSSRSTAVRADCACLLGHSTDVFVTIHSCCGDAVLLCGAGAKALALMG